MTIIPGSWGSFYGASFVKPPVRIRHLMDDAFGGRESVVTDYVFDIPGTPCEQVIDQCCLIHFPDRLLDLFPNAATLQQAGLVSYLGMPLLDVDGKILGHLAVVDRRPMPNEQRVLAIFQIFAARAAAELQRLRRETEIREREEKLGRLVDSAMDAIIELDETQGNADEFGRRKDIPLHRVRHGRA